MTSINAGRRRKIEKKKKKVIVILNCRVATDQSALSFVSVRFHDFFKVNRNKKLAKSRLNHKKHVDAAKVSGKQADIYTGLPP